MPAAFCGVTGLAPTFGAVPAQGCVPLTPSLDRIGPLAHGARDCAAVLAVLTGSRSSRIGPIEGPHSEAGRDLSGMRIGVVREHHFPPDGDAALAGLFDSAVAVLIDLGASTTEITLPFWAEAITATIVAATAEGLAYHHEDLAKCWADYTPAARGLLATGAMVNGADYVRAQRMQSIVGDALGALFGTVDVIVCPTAAIAAPRFDELADGSGHQDGNGVFGKVLTPYWNTSPNPVLSVPIGRNGEGLPMAMQIAGAAGVDHTVLRVGTGFQERTDWHRPRALPRRSPIVDRAHNAIPMQVSEQAGVTVAALLGAAHLPADGVERTGMVARYPALRSGLDALRAVAGLRDVLPLNRIDGQTTSRESA